MLLDLLLRKAQAPACETVGAWLPTWRRSVVANASLGPFASSVVAAMQADRMAWVFFTGYQGALQAAFPGVLASNVPHVAAFCANETGRKLTEIDTALLVSDGAWLLDGDKSWVLAGLGDLDLYVLARTPGGERRGPGSLSVARVPSNLPGVTQSGPRPQDVVPELAHGAVAFRGVRVEPDQILPGDGYAEYAKPFRLREDVFVTGCTLAFLLAQGHRANWPTSWRQRCLAVLLSLDQCASLPPSGAPTALHVAGALGFAGDLINQADGLWSQEDPAAMDRWQRDKPILALGKDARRQRVTKAWSQYEPVAPQQQGKCPDAKP